MRFGSHGDYHWLEWRADFLHDVIVAFPEIVCDHYVVITSFDSGPLQLTDEELRSGWQMHGENAYSPQIDDLTMLPQDQYDEWYIFTQSAIQSAHLNMLEVFINNGGFSLQAPGATEAAAISSATYGIPLNDWIVAKRKEQERFWVQLQMIAPETYLAEGDFLILVTRNTDLYHRVMQWSDTRVEP